MEKTFSSVSGFILNNIGSRNLSVSPGFHNLIRNIRRARSKTEEERTIQKEMKLLQLKLQQADSSVAKIKEYLVRLMYCELLGHSASFSYIHAIKLAQQGSLSTKRVGYLATAMFLHENHELILLLVNTLQRDLASTNMLNNRMALSAVCQLIGAEMVPAVLPLVEEKLKHSNAAVRKNAVMALRSLYAKAPHMVQNPEELFKQALCDRDVAVMNSALQIHSDLIKENPAMYKHLVRPLVAILRQISGRKLSSDCDYHGIPAPWMQIKILKMLARLGAGDVRFSSSMYDLLEDILQQTSSLSHNIAYAVQYECLITIASIHPKEPLLVLAAQSVNKFLKSSNYNLKYMGICALSAIIRVLPSCAEEHQLTVIDCLHDPDDTIQLKTLDLLMRMTTTANVDIICNRLLEYVQSTRDTFVKRDLLPKVADHADRYQPSIHWYVDMMTKVLRAGGEHVPHDTANHVISRVKSAFQDDSDIGHYVLQLYCELLRTDNLDSQLLQLSCWVLGEYSHLASGPAFRQIIHILCSQLERRLDEEVKVWIMGALTKAVGAGGGAAVGAGNLSRVVDLCRSGSSLELIQQCRELLALCRDVDILRDVVQPRRPKEKLEYDWTLSFLDEYVSEALASGAAPYKSRQQRQAEKQNHHHRKDFKPLFSGLNFVPYQSPTTSVVSDTAASTSSPEGHLGGTASPDASLSSGTSGTSGNRADPPSTESHTGFKVKGVQRVWGPEGYIKKPPMRRSGTKPPVESRVPMSSSDTVPRVQLSTATAVGVTSTQTQRSAEVLSEADIKKKALAKALFGGLHSAMTAGSKRPLPGKPAHSEPPYPYEVSRLTGARLEVDAAHTTADDLLVLPDPLMPSLTSNPMRLQMNDNVQCLGASHESDSKLSASHEDRGIGDQRAEEKSLPSQNSLSTSAILTEPTKQPSIYDDFRVFKSDPGNLTDYRNESRTANQGSLLLEDVDPAARTSDGTSSSKPCTVLNNRDHSRDASSFVDRRDQTGVGLAGIGPTDPSTGATHDRTPTNMTPLEQQQFLLNSLQPVPRVPLALIPKEWRSLPRANGRVELCQDALLSVSVVRVWAADALGLVFYVVNHTARDVATELTIKVDASSNLKIAAGPESPTILALPPNTTDVLTTRITSTTPAPHMSISGEITYRDQTRTSRRLFFSTHIAISDLLRPLLLQTSEFGEQWPRHSHDAKSSVEVTTSVSLSKVMTSLTEKMNLHLVELIGNEAISCGTFLGGSVCLLHVKRPGSRLLDLWTKTNSQLLSQLIIKQCKEYITQQPVGKTS